MDSEIFSVMIFYAIQDGGRKLLWSFSNSRIVYFLNRLGNVAQHLINPNGQSDLVNEVEITDLYFGIGTIFEFFPDYSEKISSTFW